MPDRHALLGPSSSHRWLACPPSARLEETFPDVTSEYAEEGTQAHALCEALLTKRVIFCDDEEMLGYAEAYCDFVEEELNAAKAKTPDAKLLVEQELDFGEYVPEGFGTSDAVIVSDNVLEVIDFKYGKGVPVSAIGNPQLRLYALGAYLSLSPIYDFDTVKMAIFQPRINNITTHIIHINTIYPVNAAIVMISLIRFVTIDPIFFCAVFIIILRPAAMMAVSLFIRHITRIMTPQDSLSFRKCFGETIHPELYHLIPGF